MISLDIIAGIYLPNLWAWIFLIFVLIAEALILTLYLRREIFDKRIYYSILISNTTTTIIGYIFFDVNENGGHLFNWIPIYTYHRVLWEQTLLVIVVSFIATTILEATLNLIILMKKHKKSDILKGTIWVNLVTYIIGAIIILGYAFYSN